MKRKKSVLKPFILIVIILSVLLSFASCKRDLEEEYEQKLAVLLHEKQRLENERERILNSLDNEFSKPSYMSLLFMNLDSAIYTEVFPIMSAQDENDIALVGVMALSENELPGLVGKLTLSEYNALVASGWRSALYWNGEKELGAFIDDMIATLDVLGMELPDSLVFAYGAYSSECDETLLSRGIKTAVHSGEEGLSYVDASRPDGIWHPGRIGWRCVGASANSSTKLKDKVETDGGYALFEIGFDNSSDKYETTFFPVADNEQDADRVDKFRNMVSSFKQSVRKGRISVDGIGDTRAAFESHYVSRANAEESNRLRLAQIEQELTVIRQQITDLYNQYH